MPILETIAAHLPAPLVNAARAWLGRPRPELVIHELVETGGGGAAIDFRLLLQNVGTKPHRYTLAARVGNVDANVVPRVVDLLVNTAPQGVTIHVPRPQTGDLIPAFNSAATLYGDELVVEVSDGRRTRVQRWREHEYTDEENSERRAIQMRVWAQRTGSPSE